MTGFRDFRFSENNSLLLFWQSENCLIKLCFINHSSVAQLVEQLTVNQLVAGSSPARGANYPTFSNLEVLFKICKIFSFCNFDSDEKVLLRKE